MSHTGFSTQSLAASSRLHDAIPLCVRLPRDGVVGAAWSSTVVNSEIVPSRLSTISMVCCCCGKSMHDAVVISQKPPPPSRRCAVMVLTCVCPFTQRDAHGVRRRASR